MPGRNLYLMATGTGLAPFLSLIRDPAIYERYRRVVLVHGCRRVAELAYEKLISEELPNHEFLGEFVTKQLLYYPAITREPFRNRGRLTDILTEGRLFDDLGLDPLSAEHDRLMMCGSPAMLRDLVTIVRERGFNEGDSSNPGQYVIEKAFVER
jgi:ferredoxin--NADP+ reductase